MLNHPWLSDTDVFPRIRRSLSAELKSIEEMLSGEDRPEWIVLLDRDFHWNHSRTRIVIHEYATLDLQRDIDQPARSWLLEDADNQRLLAILRGAGPDDYRNVNMDIIDGDLCAVTVVHAEPRWIAFAEVNLAGLPEGEQSPTAQLARIITAIAILE
jgi:hypothetical protein